MINIAVIGHGVVGSGVVELLEMNKDNITRRSKKEIVTKRILDLREFNDLPYANKFTKNFDDIINDKDISIVAEVMGGINPAFDFTKRCLKAGKSVVTSNKELVAQKGAELLKIAKEHNVNYFFEASVGGGIPVIRPMHNCLAANEITEIAGILNGTTNFILTKMIKENMDFETALKIAQDLGYAERNPAADVEGADACRKICILASLACGMEVKPEFVKTEGITKITLQDVSYANSYGCVIKLIARAKFNSKSDKDEIECIVSPAFVKKSSQLASIDDVYNGVLIRGNATGDVVFYGKGAGKLPTASAVVGDIIDIAKNSSTSVSLTWEATDENIVADYKETQSEFYVRLSTQNKDAEKEINHVFENVKYITCKDAPANEYAFVTKKINEAVFARKLVTLAELDCTILGNIRLVDY